MILSPGSSGWISKYADLIERGDLIVSIEKPKELSLEHFSHLHLAQSGIVFGFPTDLLFAHSFEEDTWTSQEKLKLLLFESHLFVFTLNGGDPNQDFDLFISSLLSFYGKHNSPAIRKMMRFFVRETPEEKVEYILEKRTDIRVNLFDNALWINYLSNSFVYLDVILFHEFLRTKKTIVESNYEELALDVLKTIVLSGYSDGEMQSHEKAMFEVFLASANLDEERKKKALTFVKNGVSLMEMSSVHTHSWMFKRFLIDIAVLTLYTNHEALSTEKQFLARFCDYLHVPLIELDETIVGIEQFVLNHSDKISFLQNKNSVEHLYTNISNRWIKILGRNKDKLATELKQSKELVLLIKKSAKEELTKEEKEKVKSQFLDIVKTMPAIAIFLLPGGTILLPLVLKIIPTLVPSAFRDNEIPSK